MVSKILLLSLLLCSNAWSGSPAIFSGSNAKLLKSNLDLNGAASILTGTVDPTSSATSAPAGSLYLNTTTGKTYRKTDAGSSTNWNEYATTSAVAPSSGSELSNVGFSSALASSTLVVSLKQSDNSTDCSAGSPCKVGFHSTTAANGGYSQVSFTAANSITLAAADSIGHPASGSFPIWVYLISDTTSEICLSRSHFDEETLQSATALTGGADTSATTLWCTSAHTSKPVRKIGYILASWGNPNWSAITKSTVKPFENGCRHINGVPDECEERATITNGGSCAISSQSGSWLSSTSWSSAGVCSTVIAASYYSASPTCSCTTANGDVFCGLTTLTNTSIVSDTRNSGGASSNQTIYIRCMGPR